MGPGPPPAAGGRACQHISGCLAAAQRPAKLCAHRHVTAACGRPTLAKMACLPPPNLAPPPTTTLRGLRGVPEAIAELMCNGELNPISKACSVAVGNPPPLSSRFFPFTLGGLRAGMGGGGTHIGHGVKCQHPHRPPTALH